MNGFITLVRLCRPPSGRPTHLRRTRLPRHWIVMISDNTTIFVVSRALCWLNMVSAWFVDFSQSGPCIHVGLLCLVLCRTSSSHAHSAADRLALRDLREKHLHSPPPHSSFHVQLANLQSHFLQHQTSHHLTTEHLHRTQTFWLTFTRPPPQPESLSPAPRRCAILTLLLA